VAGLDRLERPWIVFWGLVDRRMDVDWLARLAADLDRGSILLVGPTDDPDPRLMALARVHLVGPVDYHRLPRLAHLADVLIMPYADLPVTRAMQPLKLLEYLATGKPVVVRRLPSTQAWADALDEAETAEEFSAMVRRRWAEGLPADQAQARRRLEAESWEAKAQLFERWILEGLGRLSGME
jgi:glycosyltransferase involved in cell wall biosynthesis